jgi:glyoxylase-like metal-dependent hydrolase (beta-lactamase superfamily II)
VTAADAGMLPSYDLLLTDDEQLRVGDLRIRTLSTPGHTPGSICFAIEGTPLLFTGDTLFPGGPGNTKMELGDFDSIITSIDRRIFAKFDPTTLVFPGHGLATTVGSESPHLQEWVDRGW